MKINVGFLWGTFIFCTLIIMNIGVSNGTEFKVGQNLGWRMPYENDTAMYSQWAGTNRFLVGDSLLFEYQNDSVLVVNKGGYYHCNIERPIATFTDGKTLIKLENPGPAYFISGQLEHCKKGQRLLVDVMTLHPPTPPSPPSIAIPPQPLFPGSPASPPHPSSGVSVTVISISLVMAVSTTILMLVYCAA